MKKKLSKFSRSTYLFFQVFSFYGWISLVTLIIIIVNIYNQITPLTSLLNKGLSGEDITNLIPQKIFFVFQVMLGFFLLIYLIVNIIYLMIFRFVLMRKINRSNITLLKQGNNLILHFSKKPFYFGFIIRAKLRIKNITSNHNIKYSKSPYGYLNDNEILLDSNNLFTGNYENESIIFQLIDILTLFNAKFLLDNNYNQAFYILKEKENDFKILDSSNKMDVTDPIISNQPTEGYFSTREYRSGDPIKRIHWKNTMKTGKFILKVPEEIEMNQNDINIIINCYTYSLNKIDQSEILGSFIEKVLSYIKVIIANNPNNIINIYFNNTTQDEILRVNEYNINKLSGEIISKFIFQETIPFSKFNTSKQTDKVYIFSLSNDLINNSSNYLNIYFISKHYIDTFKKRSHFMIYYKNEIYFNINLAEILKRINPIFILINYFMKKSSINLVKKNELKYLSYKNLNLIND